MKCALVTGANGFIGSHLVEALRGRNIRVKCLVRATSNLQWIEPLNVDILPVDLSRIETLIEPMQDADTVFHLAGATKAFNAQAFHQANVLVTQNLLKAAMTADANLLRFVLVSTQAAAGPSAGGAPVRENDPACPLTLYGKSKLAAEQVALSYSDQFPVTVIRPPSVFGPRDKDFLQLFKTISLGINAVLGVQSHYASFIFVEDLVQGMIQAAESDQTIGRTYFFATEERISLERFSQSIADVMGRRTVKIRVPVWIFACIALIREGISRLIGKPNILNWDKVKEYRERFWICDSSQAKMDFNFCKINDLKTALQKTYHWYVQQGWL